MQTLSIHHISEEKPRHIITECDDTDACKSCGAGYRVGLTACEYCRTAIQWPADGSMSPPIYGDGSGQALPCRMDEIHIDHITPISTAQTEIEVLALNHFTNLRPMWASENMSKHNKLTHLI